LTFTGFRFARFSRAARATRLAECGFEISNLNFAI